MGTAQQLGELEEAVMGVLRQAQSPLTVRNVLSEINSSRTLAYTTVILGERSNP